MKTPIPSSVLSSARYTVAAYDVTAFLPVPYDVGGRALFKSTGSKPRRASLLPLLIVAILVCAIVILAVAAAGADTLPKTNGAVVVRYSDKIAFGVAQAQQADKLGVESTIQRRMRSLNSPMNGTCSVRQNLEVYGDSQGIRDSEPGIARPPTTAARLTSHFPHIC